MHRSATAPTLRSAWLWWRDNYPPNHPRRNLAADAYAVLGDPRRRATYDEDHPRAGRKKPALPKAPRPTRQLPRRPARQKARPVRRRKRWSVSEGALLGVAISAAIALAALVITGH